MLPAHLAENIRKQVLFYLQSTFDFREKSIEKAFERFLTDPDSGLFKGPWVQLRRPFRPADANETVPFNFPVAFHPFKHQNRSWRRLTSKSQKVTVHHNHCSQVPHADSVCVCLQPNCVEGVSWGEPVMVSKGVSGRSGCGDTQIPS
jgi:hypothetical protein